MLLRRMCALLLALLCMSGPALADGTAAESTKVERAEGAATDEAPDAAADEAESADEAGEVAAEAAAMTVEALAGTWQLIEYSVGDEQYTDADLSERGELLALNADGSATRTRYGDSEQGEWALTDGALSLTMDGETLRLEYDGMALKLNDGDVSARYIRDTSALYALEYDGAQAQAMCNLLNGGLFVRAGDELYGLSWDEDGAAMLAVRELMDTDDVAGEARALDAQCMAQYLNLSDDTLYYVRVGLDGASGIYSLKLDGGEPVQLLEGEFSGLQLSGDRLYYLDAAQKLYSCALDGSNAQEEMGFRAYYAYMLTDDWLLYQSDEDEETLHAHRLSDGYDVSLTDERSYLPVLHGGYVYYFGKSLDDESAGVDDVRLCRLELATLSTERTAGYCGAYLAVNSDTFFTANGYKLYDLDAWWTLQNADTAEVTSAPVYADDEYLISLEYSDGIASRIAIERLADRAAVSVN